MKKAYSKIRMQERFLSRICILQLGRTNFHRVHHFDKIDNKICCLAEKEEPDLCGRSAIYPPGEEPELPSWLMYDGQV